MVRKFVVLSGAVAVICAYSLASVPAYSVPLASLKADSNVTPVSYTHLTLPTIYSV